MKSWPFPTPEPGLYFDMPFADYLAIPALSNSGIKDLLVGGPNFWANSWMNPNRKARADKPHQRDGRAYHVRVLEGRQKFRDLYAPDFVLPDDPTILCSNAEMIGALQRIGVPGATGKTAAALANMIKTHLPQMKTEHALRAEHALDAGGRELLSPDLYQEIEVGGLAIEHNPHINFWTKGGYPEVTCIWRDAVGRVCKCRFDYLKIGSITDLKTVANEKNRRFDKAVDYAIAGNKYLIQPAWYLEGARHAQKHVGGGRVHGPVDTAWLTAFHQQPVTEFRFIFHQKGMALQTLGRIYALANAGLGADNDQVKDALNTFQTYMDRFGPDDMWYSMEPPQHIDRASLPAFINDL